MFFTEYLTEYILNSIQLDHPEPVLASELVIRVYLVERRLAEVESPVLIMADLALVQDQDLLSVVDSSDNTQLVLAADFRSENKTKMYILLQEQENKM
jgi:2-phospho-L-lactate guanylyltransferase (CobY/MobA/RfbA family)